PCRIDVRALKEADEWLEEYRRLWEERLRPVCGLLPKDQGAGKTGGARGRKKKERTQKKIAPRSLDAPCLRDPPPRRSRCGPTRSTWRNGGGRTASPPPHMPSISAQEASGASSCTGRMAATTRTGSRSTKSLRLNVLPTVMTVATTSSRCNSPRR